MNTVAHRKRLHLTGFLPYYPPAEHSSWSFLLKKTCCLSLNIKFSIPAVALPLPAFRLLFNQPIKHFSELRSPFQRLWGHILKTVIDWCHRFPGSADLERRLLMNAFMNKQTVEEEKHTTVSVTFVNNGHTQDWMCQRRLHQRSVCVNKFGLFSFLIDQMSLGKAEA